MVWRITWWIQFFWKRRTTFFFSLVWKHRPDLFYQTFANQVFDHILIIINRFSTVAVRYIKYAVPVEIVYFLLRTPYHDSRQFCYLMYGSFQLAERFVVVSRLLFGNHPPVSHQITGNMKGKAFCRRALFVSVPSTNKIGFRPPSISFIIYTSSSENFSITSDQL